MFVNKTIMYIVYRKLEIIFCCKDYWLEIYKITISYQLH